MLHPRQAPVLLLLMLLACDRAGDDRCLPRAPEDLDRYVQEIEAERSDKERHFRLSPESPVPEGTRATWSGLEHYPVDPAWRLEGPLLRKARPDSVTIVSTTGARRPALAVGHFLLEVGGEPQRLVVFEMLDVAPEHAGSLFLPFLDDSSEEATYPAGRYLEPEALGGGRYRLDFNRAYNPWCAYGGHYSCPITPEPNRLRGVVTAGERGWVHPEDVE